MRDFGVQTTDWAEGLASELCEARLSALNYSARQGLGLTLELAELYPSGQAIFDFEQSLKRLCPSVPFSLNLANAAGRQSLGSSELRAVLDWRSCHLMQEQPLLAQSLNDADLVEQKDGTYAIELDQLSLTLLDESVLEAMQSFVRERGGLPFKLDVRCRKTADSDEQNREFEDYMRHLSASLDERRSLSDAAEKQAQKADSRRVMALSGGGPKKKEYRRKKLPGLVWGAMYERKELCALKDIGPDTGYVQIEGRVVNPSFTPTPAGTYMRVNFDLYDDNGAVSCILFSKNDQVVALRECLEKKSCFIRADAQISFDDKFSHDLQARIEGFMEAKERERCRVERQDFPRVELHAHTKMSAKDALADPAALVRKAATFKHPAIAITDHGVVQAFPEAYQEVERLRKLGQEIKLIYGLEGYLVDDGPCCVYGCGDLTLAERFVALDVETTGLDPARERLVEVACLRYEKNAEGRFVETAKLVRLVNPGFPLPPEIAQLTGLNDMELLNQPFASELLPEVKAFIGDDPIVAHNALFDLGFLRAEAFRTEKPSDPRLKFNSVAIDTLQLARSFLPGLERYRLDHVAAALGLPLTRHHRAEDDARCSAEIFLRLYEREGSPPLAELNRRAGQLSPEQYLARKHPSYHIILLARNHLGLYHLYRLVSESHLRYISSRPRIPRSLLDYLRTGLLLGSACEAGELFRSVRELYVDCGRDYALAVEKLQSPEYKKRARYYDYLEIQPLCNNRFLINNANTGILYEEDLIKLNRLVIELAARVEKPVVATGDVHYIEPEEGVYREMMLSNMGYEDAERQADLYFRTTDEMLHEFSYLGEEKAWEIVVAQPFGLAALVENDLRPFPEGSFPPDIPEAKTLVKELCYERAHALYDAGEGLPEIIERRLCRELDAIITHGFAIMYYIAHRVVRQSNEDGYIVGSRGSVGSSLVATFCGITEVNPLPPHYYCKACRYSEFELSGRYGSGYDLPAKVCPVCGADLQREGQDIPFETFLGFNGDKQPDIDLNFSGEYQSKAHLFIEEMFGKAFTYRAGTIGAYAEKNAQGLVRAYLEAHGKVVPRAEVSRLAQAFIGVKRTTGQHPGGIVVIPKDREIYEFTPVQYPADNQTSPMQTTHFDFKAMHDTILKLDILSHDDPTVLHMLSELTGVNVLDLPIPDEEVMRMFVSTDPLRFVRPSEQDSSTLGIPEMGTLMARDMIRETRPTRFYDLVQLMGLSHGTDVWRGNAQTLIQEGVCDINQVIGCRDSIMTSLIYKGLPSKNAFDIMEKVRKGKGISAEEEALMRENQVEDWYIDSCKKIKYMFPKAHAVAYAISSLRVAWFKIHKPVAYYSAYFTVRADEFDSQLMCCGYEQICVNRRRYERFMQMKDASPKDKNAYYILELVEEMYNRGIEFLPIELMSSEAERFMPQDDAHIRPPLNIISGFSTAMAENLVKTREEDGAFSNKDELSRRAQLGPSAIKALEEAGVLRDLPDSAQISFFELLDSP